MQEPGNPYCAIPMATNSVVSGGVTYPTSVLNVLAEDGYSVIGHYMPNGFACVDGAKNFLELVQANGMKAYLGHQANYYDPTIDPSTPNGNFPYTYNCQGTFEMDECTHLPDFVSPYHSAGYLEPNVPNALNKHQRHNLQEFLDKVYTQAPYKDGIWGHHMCEEGSYPHDFYWAPDGTHGARILEEMPASILNSALAHFSNSVPPEHRLGVMEANHGRVIHAGTDDAPNPGGQPDCNDPQDFIQELAPYRKQGVSLEGSYVAVLPNDWYKNKVSAFSSQNDGHYLGFLQSLEYSKNYVDEVHDVIIADKDEWIPVDGNYINSDVNNLLNGNWLWAQSYLSVIHGANGVWFWTLPKVYNSWEQANNVPNTTKKYSEYWKSTYVNRFERQFFPHLYKKYLGPIGKEFRYLTEQGFLDSDPQSVILTKKGEADACGVVPPSVSYLLPAMAAGLNSTQIREACPLLTFYYGTCELTSENFGLRYTIRTNGEETIMIVANVTPVKIDNVTLDFSNVPNEAIQTASSVDVLFQNSWPTTSNVQNQIIAQSYKVNRDQVSDWSDPNGLQFSTQSLGSNRKVDLAFGPLDVHVLRFKPGQVANDGCEKDWEKTWSNHGKGWIGGWKISDDDHFTAGDFDGDGDEELLCANTVGGNNWMAMLNYVNGEWKWMWSNYGNAHSMLNYKKRFISGNFDADPEFELVGIGDTDIAFFDYSGGNWVLKWASDIHSNPLGLQHYRHTLQAGNFDGGNKWELVGKHAIYGTFSTFFPDLDVVPFNPGMWFRVPGSHSVAGNTVGYVPVDINGEGKDEMILLGPWAVTYDFRTSWNDWRWTASTQGGGFSCWPYNYPNTFTGANNEVLLAGDIDGADMSGGSVIPKEELLLLKHSGSGLKGVTFDFDFTTGNWACNCLMTDYLGDWPLETPANGTDGQYVLIKAEQGEPAQLLAIRRQGCQHLASMYKSINGDKKGAEERADPIESKLGIEILPNPNQGSFTLHRSNADGIGKTEIFALSGNKVAEFNFKDQEYNREVDLTGVASGVYLVRVHCTGFPVVTKRLIID